MPANFSRFKRGDQLITQELNKLLQLDAEHHTARPLLTEDGRVRLKDPASGKVVIGMKWNEVLTRAPQYFSVKYAKARGEAYGKAVHADLVRCAKQLAGPNHIRTVFWHVRSSNFFLGGWCTIFDCDFFVLFENAMMLRSFCAWCTRSPRAPLALSRRWLA